MKLRLLLAGIALLFCGSVHAQSRVDALLAQTYGTGGGNTEWIPPSQLLNQMVVVAPSAPWANQVYDCALNSCLHFPVTAPYTYTVGTPTARTLVLATAYQATTSSKPAWITVNVTSSAGLSLSGGTTNTASIVMGPTTAVAAGTGTTIDGYSNSNTGALTIGLNLSTISAVPATILLPAGWFFAILQTSGTVTISSAFDQSMG